MPEIIDLVFAKTSPKRSFSMTENERFGLVFANTGSINSGTGGKHLNQTYVALKPETGKWNGKLRSTSRNKAQWAEYHMGIEFSLDMRTCRHYSHLYRRTQAILKLCAIGRPNRKIMKPGKFNKCRISSRATCTMPRIGKSRPLTRGGGVVSCPLFVQLGHCEGRLTATL